MTQSMMPCALTPIGKAPIVHLSPLYSLQAAAASVRNVSWDLLHFSIGADFLSSSSYNCSPSSRPYTSFISQSAGTPSFARKLFITSGFDSIGSHLSEHEAIMSENYEN